MARAYDMLVQLPVTIVRFVIRLKTLDKRPSSSNRQSLYDWVKYASKIIALRGFDDLTIVHPLKGEDPISGSIPRGAGVSDKQELYGVAKCGFVRVCPRKVS